MVARTPGCESDRPVQTGGRYVPNKSRFVRSWARHKRPAKRRRAHKQDCSATASVKDKAGPERASVLHVRRPNTSFANKCRHRGNVQPNSAAVAKTRRWRRNRVLHDQARPRLILPASGILDSAPARFVSLFKVILSRVVIVLASPSSPPHYFSSDNYSQLL